QAAVSLAGCRKHCVDQRGNKGDGADFACSTKRPRAAVYEIHFYWRHFGHSRNLIIVEVALNDPPPVKSDFRLHSIRQAKSHAALERISCYPRIKYGSGIRYDHYSVNLDDPGFGRGQLNYVTDKGSEGLTECDAAMVTSRRRVSPTRFLCRQIENCQRSRAASQQLSAVGVGIDAFVEGHLVDKTLERENVRAIAGGSHY